jgi:hypothetical protein
MHEESVGEHRNQCHSDDPNEFLLRGLMRSLAMLALEATKIRQFRRSGT